MTERDVIIDPVIIHNNYLIEVAPDEFVNVTELWRNHKQLLKDNDRLKENENNLQNRIDKTIEFIDNLRDESAERQGFYNCFPNDLYIPNIDELLNILKGNDEN